MSRLFNFLAVVQNTGTASSNMNAIIIVVIIFIVILVAATMFSNRK